MTSGDGKFPSDPIVVVGIVHPHGRSSSKADSGVNEWILRCKLVAWRDENGNLHTDTLMMSCQLDEEALQTHAAALQPYQMVAAHVVFTARNAGTLLELLEPPLDEALAAFAAELQRPKLYQHERFGAFTFDRQMNWYEANAMWKGTGIYLRIDAEEDGEVDADVQAAAQVAVQLWDNETAWGQRIEDYIVAELLALKNETWLDDDEAELSAEDFKARMTLESVSTYLNGAFEFWFDDGDLFFGHVIFVGGTLTDGPTRADIMG